MDERQEHNREQLRQLFKKRNKKREKEVLKIPESAKWQMRHKAY